MKCPLCLNTSLDEYDAIAGIFYLQCIKCGSVFKRPEYFPTLAEERARYLLHENNPDNAGYQAFVMPLVNSVLKSVPNLAVGLDFGAGTGPVAAKILEKKGYKLTLYDPFFHPNKDALNTTYDFIICCEVIEHFHRPHEEFQLLRKLLKPGGTLFCMTYLLPNKSVFKDWYYKNDPTHVIFYAERSIKWIQSSFNFSEVKIDGRLIIFETN